MPVDPTALANLIALSTTTRVPCAEYLKVTWAPGVVNYYGAAAYHENAPFTGIGHTIEARLLPQNKKDPFHELEINPDLRTDAINITFDDIDKAITQKFQQYSSGVACEVVLYYPISPTPITYSIWSGQLQAPAVYGWKTLKTTATNGFRSRELFIPNRMRPRECTANIFGGLLPDVDSVRSNLCPYDKHLGGSEGLYRTGVTPFTDCPKDVVACQARFGHSRYFAGFNTDASATTTGSVGHNYYLAISKGNASNLAEPIRVIFGQKYVRANQLLLWRPESPPGYAHGFVATVWEVCEGPVQSIYNFKVNGTNPQAQQAILGNRGQNQSGYASNVSNWSGLANFFARYGWVDTATISGANDLSSECIVQGFSEVCVYTAPSTKTRVYSTDRVWCLLEMYHNQKFGMGYAETQFNVADFITASTWGLQMVTLTVTFPDGESRVFVSPRSSFNAILEGRAVAEQIEDICRSGGLSVPFQHEGLFTLATFRAATSGEISAARVFTDVGQNVNIIWDGGQPMIELSQTPDNKVVNEIELKFEESANTDTERPITVDDRNQKLKAGRQLGANYFLTVPKRYVGFGISTLAETLRIAYRLLKYGEFDEGGTDNNLRVTMTVPFEQVLNIRRYDIIQIVSSLITGFLTPTGVQFQYFRVLHMKKVANNRCQITAQAYNKASYEAFEVDSVISPPGGGSNVLTVFGAGTPTVNGSYDYDGQVNGKGSYIDGSNSISWSGSQWEMYDYSSDLQYRSTSAVAFPWLATWTVSGGCFGRPPLPRVVQILPRDPGRAPVTLGAPSYNSTTGTITFSIS